MTQRAGRRRLTPRRLAVFAVAALISASISLALLLAIDVYLHRKFERSAGFNIWGYRGPAVGRKQPGEYRVAMLGGSTAYGYGVTWDEAIPAVLQKKLAARPPNTYAVVNLGYNNEGAYAFQPTLQDYRWLAYDLACLYEGYNDLMADARFPNVSVFRHESPVFRLTGYLPIFPIVFKEKAAVMLSGDVNAMYPLYQAPDKTVFRPGLATKTVAEALKVTAAVGQALERQVGRLSSEPRHEITDVASTGCMPRWQQYCRSVLVAAEFVLQQGGQVLVVTQPYQVLGENVRARHIEQQREMAAMLRRRFGAEPRVQHVDLGDAVDLRDPTLAFDGVHLTVAGNHRIAERLVDPVLAMAAQRSAGLRTARH